MNPTITEVQRDLAYDYWAANYTRLPAASEPVSRMHAAMDFYGKHPLHVKASRVCDPYPDTVETIRGYLEGLEGDITSAVQRSEAYTTLVLPMIYRDAGLVEMAASDLGTPEEREAAKLRALEYFRQALSVATKGATYLMPAVYYLMLHGDNDPISHGERQ